MNFRREIVNGSLKCSDFGSNTTVDSATMMQ